MTEPLAPAELLKRYYPLEGIVSPLVELIKVNPDLTQAVVELALAYGITAAERKYRASEIDREIFPNSPRIDWTQDTIKVRTSPSGSVIIK